MRINEPQKLMSALKADLSLPMRAEIVGEIKNKPPLKERMERNCITRCWKILSNLLSSFAAKFTIPGGREQKLFSWWAVLHRKYVRSSVTFLVLAQVCASAQRAALL